MANDQTIELRFATDTAALTRTTQQVEAMRTSVANVGQQFRAAGDGGRAGAMGILYLSQTIEDLQYGLSAVINNIPMLVMAMGGGPGLAGVVSIAAVGVNVLARNWDGLMSAFGNSKVETEAERMERLAKATKLTADEAKELARFQATQEADKRLGAIGGAKSDRERNALADTVKQLGGNDAISLLFEASGYGAQYRRLLKASGGEETEFLKGLRRDSEAAIKRDLDMAMGNRGTPEQQAAARDRLANIVAASPNLSSGPMGDALLRNQSPDQADAARARGKEAQRIADDMQVKAKLDAAEWEKERVRASQEEWVRFKAQLDLEQNARDDVTKEQQKKAAELRRQNFDEQRLRQRAREAERMDPQRFMNRAIDNLAADGGFSAMGVAMELRRRQMLGQGKEEATIGATNALAQDLFAMGQNGMGPILTPSEAVGQAMRLMREAMPEANFLGEQMRRMNENAPRAVQAQEMVAVKLDEAIRKGVPMVLRKGFRQ